MEEPADVLPVRPAPTVTPPIRREPSASSASRETRDQPPRQAREVTRRVPAPPINIPTPRVEPAREMQEITRRAPPPPPNIPINEPTTPRETREVTRRAQAVAKQQRIPLQSIEETDLFVQRAPVLRPATRDPLGAVKQRPLFETSASVSEKAPSVSRESSIFSGKAQTTLARPIPATPQGASFQTASASGKAPYQPLPADSYKSISFSPPILGPVVEPPSGPSSSYKSISFDPVLPQSSAKSFQTQPGSLSLPASGVRPPGSMSVDSLIFSTPSASSRAASQSGVSSRGGPLTGWSQTVGSMGLPGSRDGSGLAERSLGDREVLASRSTASRGGPLTGWSQTEVSSESIPMSRSGTVRGDTSAASGSGSRGAPLTGWSQSMGSMSLPPGSRAGSGVAERSGGSRTSLPGVSVESLPMSRSSSGRSGRREIIPTSVSVASESSGGSDALSFKTAENSQSRSDSFTGVEFVDAY